jgi:hypothetical protein
MTVYRRLPLTASLDFRLCCQGAIPRRSKYSDKGVRADLPQALQELQLVATSGHCPGKVEHHI